MKNKLLLIAVLAVVAVVAVALLFNKPKRSDIEVTVKANRLPLKESLKLPRPVLPKRKIENNTPPKYSAECLDFWEGIRSIDFGKWNISKGGLPNPGNCPTSNEPEKAVYDQYQKLCFTSSAYEGLSQKQKDEQLANCQSMIFFLRAIADHRLTEDFEAKDINDIPTLVDRLMASFLLGFGSKDTVGVEKNAERILELSPNLYPAAKASFLASLMGVMKEEESKTPVSDETWKKVEAKLERLERLSHNDPQMELMKVWVRTRNLEPDRVRDELAHGGVAPGTANFLYLQAYLKNKSGAKKEAAELLKQGVKAFPADTRFKNTLAECKKDPNCKYEMVLNFNFSLEDLEK